MELVLHRLLVMEAALANLGHITNKGIELLIKGEIMRTDDFTWEASLNYSKNTSEVVATNDAGGNIGIGKPRDLQTGLNVTHIVGEQWGALYGNGFERDSQGRIIHINQGWYSCAKNWRQKNLRIWYCSRIYWSRIIHLDTKISTLQF